MNNKGNDNNQFKNKDVELKSCLKNLKEEVTLFLGTKKDYLSDFKKNHASNRLSFVLISLEKINKNLNKIFKKEKINLHISGIIINNENSINKIIYKPFICLKTNLFSIEFNKGFFFDKYKVFDNKEDYILIEPVYEIRKNLSTKEIDKIINIINTVIAELSQYVYKENIVIKDKKVNKKRQQYLNFIEDESKDNNI